MSVGWKEAEAAVRERLRRVAIAEWKSVSDLFCAMPENHPDWRRTEAKLKCLETHLRRVDPLWRETA